ncbi:Cyclin B2, partial [Prunus dulcis]
VIEMGSKENNPGPRLVGTKFVKEVGPIRRQALRDVQNITRANEVCSTNGPAVPKGTKEETVTSLVANPSGVGEHDVETKKLSSSTANSSCLVDCEIVDVEDNEDEVCDAPVPMFVKHTEAMLDEIDRMEEDEDVEEPVMDIDSCGSKDPLNVVEYIDDIYAHYRKTEKSSCISPIYMAHQPDINEKMRAILIDWLIEVHYKFELMDETLFLTVNLIDRFLESQMVIRKKLQLVGVTAMLLACKYEEAYSRKDVLDMEKSMVNSLQFNFSVPTPFVFMKRFLKAAQSDKKVPPSKLAAAAIYTAQCSLSRFKQWSKTSEWYTNYSEDELLRLKLGNLLEYTGSTVHGNLVMQLKLNQLHSSWISNSADRERRSNLSDQDFLVFKVFLELSLSNRSCPGGSILNFSVHIAKARYPEISVQ